MRAIIEIDVPDYQIGQEVSIYFKDTMMIKGVVQEPSGDAISRQAVLYLLEDTNNGWIINEVSQLPPVNPQEPKTIRGLHLSQKYKDWQFIQEPKTGHWIEKDGFDGDTYYDCSECGESWTTIEGTPWDNEWNYCPNCGARMTESDHKCHTCKHYLSGEYDGSCDSYVCNGYSDWESDNCN